MKFWDKYNAAKWIYLFFLLFVVYIIIDAFDIPSHIDSHIVNINSEIFGSVANALVVIVLYIISYFAIEKRQQQKDDNAKEIANLLLKNTYKECIRTLECFSYGENYQQYILPKVKQGAIIDENSEIEILYKPFENTAEIMHLAENGYISKHNLQNYINTKSRFSSVVSSSLFWLYENKLEDIDNTYQKQKCEKEISLLIDRIKFHIEDLTDEEYD